MTRAHAGLAASAHPSATSGTATGSGTGSGTAGDPERPRLSRSAGETLGAMLPYLWPKGRRDLRVRVVVSLFCLVLAKVGAVYIPYTLKLAVDHLGGEGEAAASMVDTPMLTVPLGLILAYGVVRLVGLGFGQVRDAVFARVSGDAIRAVSREVFSHLHALSLRFHLSRQTGGLTRVIYRGTNSIQTLLRVLLFNGLPTVLELVLVTLVLWSFFDWRFAAITLGMVGLYLWWTIWLSNKRIRIRRALNDSDNDATTKAVDSLLNFETVKYFTNESFETQRYDRSMERYANATVRVQTSLSLLNFGQIAIISAGLIATMLLAAQGVVNGAMTVGDFVLVNAYLIQLAQPLGFFGFMYREIIQCLVDMEQMFALKRETAEVGDRPGAPPLLVERAAVRFTEVSFHYDPKRAILHDISFEIPAGRTVAVVGPSGAGKSTLTRLLFRFYDPVRGRVEIDGQDVSAVQQISLRRQIGIVPQDTVLFNDTIGANILYGRPDAPRAEMEEAARLAHIDGFIASLPDGYDTLVGERGLKLSGGEKQRVAIARTILKNPPILILDEATSALDTATEQAIQANLAELSANRTTLVIAHRLSTVVDADEILVMEAGRIVERGSHGDLLAAEGLFAQMWARQARDGDDSTVNNGATDDSVSPTLTKA